MTTHTAVNQGNNDQWVPSKGAVTMAYLTRNDIPFHYALADAFTICDAYHCSLLGPTDPNRYYMWTGWVGNNGAGGGPVIDNAEAKAVSQAPARPSLIFEVITTSMLTVITLEIHNHGQETHHLHILDAYTHKTVNHRLKPGENLREFWRLEATFGWYDFTVEADSDSSFRQRLAGHLETGRDSMSDPAIAAAQPV
jgi:hypothetical protein